MLSEGLAKLTLGRRDEFEAGKIKKNKLLRGIIIIKKKLQKSSANFVHCGVGWEWNPVGEQGSPDMGHSSGEDSFIFRKKKNTEKH